MRRTLIPTMVEGGPPPDKSLQVHYRRMENASLLVFIDRGDLNICEITVGADNKITLTVGDKNTASVFVYPPSALTRDAKQAELQQSDLKQANRDAFIDENPT